MWHNFTTDISSIELPTQFTYPFHYTPHPLCVKAAREVKDYLAGRTDWQEELQAGKMFGVLIVRNVRQEVGFLAAFSGILAGSNTQDYFVPPVYDFLQPDSFFRKEEAEISELNHQIDKLEQEIAKSKEAPDYLRNQQLFEEDCRNFKAQMKADKARRDQLRRQHPEDAGLLAELTRESQFQKAELKRKEKYWKALLAQNIQAIEVDEDRLNVMKQFRKERSATLQEELFRRFRLLNARGEETDLLTLFDKAVHQLPPAGAGECAAPKLLQYAYTHQLQPLALAEFWWGHTTQAELRRHGAFYPACQSKCGPILNYMMQGLNVEPNPLHTEAKEMDELEVAYEDEYLMVIVKPEGLLSVPGKGTSLSVYDLVRQMRPEAEGPLIVHRLDQATSGLMVIAKRKEVHETLQKQFLKHQIKKRYAAILEKEITPQQGDIRLPLCPNPNDRPRQQVNDKLGKPAHTHYEVVERGPGYTRIAFYPHTGRTHQLRVHAAHPDGLHAPIQGDKLYGATHTQGRLCLHADRLEFEHPITRQRIVIEIAAPF
jgi:tRNA pseudouridine32 synthase/23S rRNA pseudouridine746 synthase